MAYLRSLENPPFEDRRLSNGFRCMMTLGLASSLVPTSAAGFSERPATLKERLGHDLTTGIYALVDWTVLHNSDMGEPTESVVVRQVRRRRLKRLLILPVKRGSLQVPCYQGARMLLK